MQGVNVFENGTGFLLKCLNLYTGGTGFFILYLLALLLILYEGSRQERELFIPQAAVLTITVFNPLFPLILDRIFDVNSEYYRFFWLAPVIILVPYTAVKLITGAKDKGGRILTASLIAAMFVAGANFVYGKGIHVAENIYRIPDELIEICGIIHADDEAEYSKAFFEYDYNMEARQYDPRILLCVDREDYLYAVNYSYTDEMLHDDGHPVYKILARLVRHQNVEREDFLDALDATGTGYVVLTRGQAEEGFIREAGLYEIGKTDTHIIYRYDLKDPVVYEPVDYSSVTHTFSYRRLK